jgi:hypothetical protein
VWKDYDKDKEDLISWKAYRPCVVWEKWDYNEDKKGLWIIFLKYWKYYDFKLDVVRKILLRKKCVCDIEERGGNFESK